ncbi:efflux RND transporter periplasmic adaptor subunit [Comamonas aquatica]|uniref:Efflux RND transporter periplasmic adaptor subunit n=1 Tax=Comamonas aquatica TaxID=225991 RepID=A0AA42HXZ2_9BURK|nr:efflux RND transporter periplasmic adaptor subunit [Comamonas aquatica]MDH0365001.1 efflux RND transporter periplasmic adaptor subunit [Comamonas aquatica]MDH1765683.1 efflux RND transporter periplasmic adaptor subunit [Comamonas aquatica]
MAAAALAVVLVAACGKTADKPAAQNALAKVGVVVLQKQSQMLDTVLPGRTQAFLSAEVRPQVSGIVQKRLFTEGGMVKQGQPLYQLDAASLRAAEASAVAALAKAEASQQTLEATARRNAELVKITAISQQAYEESQAAAKQSRADVAVARANLENARINLKYSRIEAPISGRISLSSVTPGALVTANQTTPLTNIVQMDPMYVDFTQSSADLLQLRRDWEAGRYQKIEGDQMPVRIRLEDGSDYPHEGKLQFAGLIVNATMGTVTLRAVVPNPEGLLMPGMFVQAQLPTGLAPEAILVPQQSVTRDLTGRPSVLVVKDGDVVEKRAVELSRAVGTYWLLDSGLEAGERVVVDGFQRIKPGDTVSVVEVDLKAKQGPKRVDAQAAAANLRAAVQASK